MKSFFKLLTAAMLGVILAFVIVGVVLVGISGALVAAAAGSDSNQTVQPNESVLKINFSGVINDTASDHLFAALLGDDKTLALSDVINAIENAKSHKHIKGIYLNVGVFSAGGTASIDAIRRELIDFKQSGKFVVAYADNYTQGGYYLASVADSVYLNPQGLLELSGLASQTLFYKGLLKKIGVEMVAFKVGTYKGAIEPFVADNLSEPNREQISAYVHGVWNSVTQNISESRHISQERISEFADRGLFFGDPAESVSFGLIDGLRYRDEVESLLITLAEQDSKRLKTASVSKLKNVSTAEKTGDKIALLFAEGEITSEDVPYSGQKRITEKLGNEVRKLKDDDDYKAVVLRINSPGGSGFIAEQIWRQVDELRKVKPVVVSMGNVAASGGYYIACPASKIVAEANTLTGSIGVFAMFPDVSELFHKADLNSNIIKTNKFSDMGDLSRSLTAEESALMQGFVERFYEVFLKRCAEGRGMSRDAVDAVAQGRIWTGEMALSKNLVDELGGIDRAVEVAAELAELKHYQLIDVSPKEDFFSLLLDRQLSEVFANHVPEEAAELLDLIGLIRHSRGIQARIPYDLKPL